MSPRILIAEDDAIQGAVLRSALKGRGYEAEIVTDGLEALHKLRASRYDVALLDYHMPVVDGMAAARLLHDFMGAEDRPRLIAITAAVEGLSEKELTCGGSSFDAVVSKRAGLPALLQAIDDNLATAAALQAASAVRAGRDSARHAVVLRRQRVLRSLAALPAFGMAAVFLAAFVGAVLSLQGLGTAVGTAQRTGALSTDTAALVGAVQDAEASQRTYLATGSDAHRMQFEADAQRVDQLMAAATSLAADGSPGLGAAAETQAVIEPHMRALAQQAELRGTGGLALAAASEDTGRAVAGRLRDWAATLVSGSQQVVIDGLDAVQRNIQWLLVALAAGAAEAVWSGVKALRRHRSAAARPAPAPAPTPVPAPAPDVWRPTITATVMSPQISGPR